MKDQNIICFAKDWNEDPTSNHYVMTRFAADNNKVLWINSISTRAPRLNSARDIKKIFFKAANFLKGLKQVSPTLWVLTPIVIPLHDQRWAVSVNRIILRFLIKWARWRIGMRQFQLWAFVPTAAEYVGRLGESALVYYCTDDWTSFSFSKKQQAGGMMRVLASRADVVFATATSLVRTLEAFSQHVYLAAHGVEHALFATALEDSTRVPDDLQRVAKPVIGYYGLIESWLDLQLIRWLAERHPEWSFVLIGKVCVDVGELRELPNVHFLGRKQHHELPAYCKGFDVALIPHKVNDLTRNMNPIKLREYMSAGVPVVSSALPEVAAYPSCRIADSYEDFEVAIGEAIRQGGHAFRCQLSDSMRGETWDRKIDDIGAIVERVLGRRSA